MRLINPFMKAHRQIGKTDEQWTTLKSKLKTFLEGKAGAVPVAEARAVDSAFADDSVWAQIAGDLGLVEIPDE